jgi:hypothetical protein
MVKDALLPSHEAEASMAPPAVRVVNNKVTSASPWKEMRCVGVASAASTLRVCPTHVFTCRRTCYCYRNQLDVHEEESCGLQLNCLLKCHREKLVSGYSMQWWHGVAQGG